LGPVRACRLVSPIGQLFKDISLEKLAANATISIEYPRATMPSTFSFATADRQMSFALEIDG
jgi:hypothetical protein